VADGAGNTISVIAPVAASASTGQPSQGQLVAGVSKDVLIVVIVVVLAGLAIGTGVKKLTRRESA
jgi:hypothetical protein